MNPYAAGLSIFVSLISALTVIAMPVEIYIFGNGMIWRLVEAQIHINASFCLFLGVNSLLRENSYKNVRINSHF